MVNQSAIILKEIRSGNCGKMTNRLPIPIRVAQEKGIELFMGENCEWKFEVEHVAPFIEAMVEEPVCIFANNGYGDFLFLKMDKNGDRYDERIFEYFHEGPEVIEVKDKLDTLLGVTDREPSNDSYPKARYESGELVELGDVVKFKSWIEFWKGWQEGVICYVPGVSKEILKHEYGELKWASIKYKNGCIGPLVDPETGILRKIHFLKRK